MNDVLKTRLFSLFSEPSQATNEEIQNAYGGFMEQVKAVSHPETDYSEAFRTLNNTRIELASLELIYRYGQGKKCPEICLS